MYDRITLMWQPRPTTALPGTAKSWTFETSLAPDGPWNPAQVRSLASRNARCGEFTDVTQLPGVPGKDGDCVLVTYRMQEADQYVKATAVAVDGTKSVPSNVLFLPETSYPATLMLGVILLVVLFGGRKPGHTP